MAKLDDEIKAALDKYGLDMSAVWAHKQSGKYIAYHWACEHIAIKAGIVWEAPQVLFGDSEKKIATLLITGRMGDRVEWSIGEAAPYNTTQTYPWAMAEKRGKDRVVLKLIGVHGKVYSEEEADDFRAADPEPAPTNGPKFGGPLTKTELQKRMRSFAGELAECSDEDMLAGLLESYKLVTEQCQRDMPTWWLGDGKDSKGAKAAIDEKRKALERKAA